MQDVRDLFTGLADETLWVAYNLAFLAFGKTRAWPWMGSAIWR